MNEKRVFSSQQVLDKIEEYEVSLIMVDFTTLSPDVGKDLDRADRKNLPVNLIYPPNYPERPAVMLNELVTPDDVIFVLDYLAKSGEGESSEAVDSPPTP